MTDELRNVYIDLEEIESTILRNASEYVVDVSMIHTDCKVLLTLLEYERYRKHVKEETKHDDSEICVNSMDKTYNFVKRYYRF